MKTALVTGTSSGIGQKLAVHLIGQGWSVIGCSRREAKVGDEHYKHYRLDITDEKAVSDMFFDISSLNISNLSLINNAGIANMNHFLLSPRKSGSEMLNLNALAAIDCMRHYSKFLLKNSIKSGRIINLSSVATTRFIAGQLWYAASKSALETATKVASKELSEINITANCIRIPYFRTPMSGSIGKERVQSMIENQSIKRLCTFADIANIVDFLLKESSDFITGETISLGGSS